MSTEEVSYSLGGVSTMSIIRRIFALTFTLSLVGLPGWAQKLPKKEVKTTTAPTATSTASESSYSGVLKFNTDDEKDSGSKPRVQFKVPGDNDSTVTADPVNAIVNDTPYKIAVGFPKWDFRFSYDPQNVSFTQKLTGFGSPTFSQTSTSAFSFTTRLNTSLDMFYEAAYAQFDTTAKAKAATAQNPIGINESTSTIDSIMLRGYTCWMGNFSNRRFCVGGELGSDSTPSLAFNGTTTLEMSKIRDIVLGPSIVFDYPLSTSLTMNTRLSALLGTNSGGQGTDLVLTSDWKVVAEAGISGVINDHNGWSISANYFQRESKVTGKQGANDVNWDVSSSSLAGRVAYIFSY